MPDRTADIVTGSGTSRRRCDVLVVGAGPAGSSAARAAARCGASVIMVDRRQRIGDPARCAGFVPAPLASHVSISREAVAQPVRRLLTHTPGGIEETDSLGYIVHREFLDRQLVREAVDAGAELFTAGRAVSHEGGITWIRSGDSHMAIESRVVIGADGPRSRVGSWMGARNTDFVRAAQWTVGLVERTRDASVFFRQEIRGGYGWLFPKGDAANVGVAVSHGSGDRPLRVLEWFVNELAAAGLVRLPAQGATGGLIPVGGPLKCRSGIFLLAGDAAGHCHPVTGAGINMAVQGGELAGFAAAEYAGGGGEYCLEGYAGEADEILGEPLRRARERRRELDGYWEAPVADFCRALRRAWVAFPEYSLV